MFARIAERHVGDFSAQGLANTAWAFAKVGHSHVSLFRALARAAERCVDDFSTARYQNKKSGKKRKGLTFLRRFNGKTLGKTMENARNPIN